MAGKGDAKQPPVASTEPFADDDGGGGSASASVSVAPTVTSLNGGGAVEFSEFLVGAWKRTLEWHHFGGNYANLRTTNTVVCVDEYFSSVREDGVRYLKWCFGKSLDKAELRFGYVMRFKRDPKCVDPNEETLVDWQYNGHACSGIYQPSTAAAVFNFHLKSSTVVITYRILNANTMAVCIVELDEQHAPTVQLGNMIRIDSAMYQPTSQPTSNSATATATAATAAAPASATTPSAAATAMSRAAVAATPTASALTTPTHASSHSRSTSSASTLSFGDSKS